MFIETQKSIYFNSFSVLAGLNGTDITANPFRALNLLESSYKLLGLPEFKELEINNSDVAFDIKWLIDYVGNLIHEELFTLKNELKELING